MTRGFSQLRGVWPRLWGHDHFCTEVNSGHRDRGLEDTHWEASAAARLIPDVLFCVFYFMQGEHSKNLFQKEKVLYPSATKAGEFCLHLLSSRFEPLRSFSE